MTAAALPTWLPGIAEPLDRILDGVERFIGGDTPAPFILAGPQSSGRRTLLKRTAAHAAERGQRVFDLEIPPFGHDTPAQVLLRIAALAPDSPEAMTLCALGSAWGERLDAAERLLDGPHSHVHLVRLPSGALPSGERADRQLQQEIAELIRSVTRPRVGKFQVVATQPWWQWQHSSPKTEIRLSLASNSREFLSDSALWGPLAATAARLTRLLGSDGDRLGPLQLRLGVALLATRTRASVVQAALAPGSNLRALEQPLQKMLAREPRLMAALTRVARARTAVDAQILEDVAGAEPADWAIVSRCFLYPEGERLRFHDQLRWLVQDDSPEPVTHDRLFQYYRQLDGATDPRTGLRKVEPWLERLHHASRADAHGDVDTWLAQNPPTREHFWEYGWSLSHVHKRYQEAARVYRELLDRVPGEDDNYGQHYYAYNLDRAGQQPLTAQEYYRKAVGGDPTNAWWNARLIGFLTERGLFDAARRAWSEALEAIDPAGDRSGGDWLPFHLHQHVARAGLESGNLDLAEAALDAIHPPAADDSAILSLRDRLDAARQVRRLGEALFPAYLNVREWWTPRLLRPRHGERMADWRPGRVLNVEADGVAVALGYRDEQEKPAIEWQVISRTEWTQAANGKPPREGDFFEYALIDGRPGLETESPDQSTVANASLQHLLRFLSTQPWRQP